MDKRRPHQELGDRGDVSDARGHGATLARVGTAVVIAFSGDIDLIAEADIRTTLDDALTLLSAGCGRDRSGIAGCDGANGAGALSGNPVPHTSAATGTNTAGTDAGGPDGGVGPAVLVMDLSAVRFFSSTGLQLLVIADRAAAARGVAFRVATGTHRSVLRTLHVTGLDTVLSVFTTRDDALAGSSPPTPRVSG